MKKSIGNLILGTLVATSLAWAVVGCSPPEKKVDPDEVKRQMKALKADLQKEQGPN